MSTLTEKIIARAASRDTVRPGDIVTARVDLAVANDMTAPLAIRHFKAAGATEVFDPRRIAIIAGRHAPFNSAALADSVSQLGEFCREQHITEFFGGGEGMDHGIMPERGMARPGMLICNGDSHASTIGAFGALGIPMGAADMAYIFAFGETWLRVPETLRVVFNGRLPPFVTSKDMVLAVLQRLDVDGAAGMAIEFVGETLGHLSIEERLTISNMAIEMGAKVGVMEPDASVDEYLGHRTDVAYEALHGDPDASVSREIRIDVERLTPLVSRPHSPGDVIPLSEAAGTAVTQVNIGTCTNGRMIDLRQAAGVLKGRQVAKGVRLIVTPATQAVWREAMREGLLEIFADAGAMVNPPGCGACAGWHGGAVGAGDVCMTTHNRNFRGRMGHRDAKIWLGNPYVAAATAVVGRISGPEAVQ